MIDENSLVESPFVEYTTGKKYQLSNDLVLDTGIKGFDIETDWIHLFKNGFMILKKGFAWDGASGPTIDTPSSIACSAGHDALYQLIRLCLLPRSYGKQADDFLEKKGIRDGMWKIRAKGWEKILNKFGRSNLLPSREKKILRAP